MISRKLLPPPAPERLVRRDRLDAQLADLIDRHRVIVVAATAGAGKTTAVASACAAVNRPSAWLSVDRTDQAPGRLVTYLEAALARALPQLEGVASRALAIGISHPEATGMLVEAVGDAPLIMVLDDLQRLGDAPDAWAVIEAFLRYAPQTMTTVLLSRRDIPVALCELPLPPTTAAIGEDDLAFTVPEATEALEQQERGGLDEPAIEAVVRVTSGWVTGVLFSAHAAATGKADDDPLATYLTAHVLSQLAWEDRDFLVRTALLEQVDSTSAAALGIENAGERMAALRSAHLPVSWQPDGLSMRCHPLLREHLLVLLRRLDPADVRALHVGTGRVLGAHGHDEDAVEVFLRVGALDEALPAAERCIGHVIDRLDFAVAERWLDQLEPVVPARCPQLQLAELMLAIGRSDFARGVALGDRLKAAGERDRFAAESNRAAGLLAQCYGEVGRLDETGVVIDAARAGPSVDVVRYGLSVITGKVDRRRPEPTGSPIDALLLATDHALGRFAEMALPTSSRWLTAARIPWRIAALRDSGRTEEALQLYTDAERFGAVVGGFAATVGAPLLVDAGRRDEAYSAIREGRAFTERYGGRWRWILSWIAEARLLLRLDRDHEGSLAALAVARDALETFPVVAAREACSMWTGFALLLAGRLDEALEELRWAVDSMLEGDRLLDLPVAAVYLAEAEWRAGDEARADRAADLALAAARRQGFDHLLLGALADFPAVASRRLDAEAGPDLPWHELGRALVARGTPLEAAVGIAVELRDIGRPELLVNGEPQRPRIAKTYELLAYLVRRPRPPSARREELLDALFDGRVDDSARAYLRQAVNQLSRCLPDPDAVVSDRGVVTLLPGVRVTTTSRRFEARLGEARSQHGAARLAATLDALQILGDGHYLEGAEGTWIDDRRRELADLAADARHEAARLMFEEDRHLEALRLNERVLQEDPVREDAWRLQMEIKGALGDDPGVLAAYRECSRALVDLGTEPAPSTRQLLERLRR